MLEILTNAKNSDTSCKNIISYLRGFASEISKKFKIKTTVRWCVALKRTMAGELRNILIKAEQLVHITV